MVRSPVHRPSARSPRVGRLQRGSSPLPRPPHRRNSASPSRRGPNSRGGGGASPPADDPRRHRGPAGDCPPRLSSTNRIPVAFMRMRMDDYTPPKAKRNDQKALSPQLEQAVVRARREATNRTKDTFWTKKLLDAEDHYSKRGDRWAHTGFKELYRDELGYEPDPQSLDDPKRSRDGRSSAPRDPRGEPRDPRDPRRNSPGRPRDPRAKGQESQERPRDPRPGATAGGRPRDPRRPDDPAASKVFPRRKSRSRSGGRSRSKKSPRHRPRQRRSYSGSYSSHSSSSSSGSYSRSRSYYSRSSYSSTGSSSYTSSSSRSRSRSQSRSRSGDGRKRRRSRSGSRSYSSSVSPPRKTKRALGHQPGAVKDGKKLHPLMLQKTETPKKVPVKGGVIPPKNKVAAPGGHQQPLGPPTTGTAKQNTAHHRLKTKMKIKEVEAPRKKPRVPPPPPPPPPPHDVEKSSAPSTSYYPIDEGNETVGRSSGAGASPSCQGPQKHGGVHAKHVKKAQPPSSPTPAEYGVNVPNNPSSPRSLGEESESSSSSEEEEAPRKMTLSERFGKLAQLSSQRQEYDGVRMKIVREGGQDKKVYLEAGLGSRSPSPLHPAHERWLAEHQAEYADYQRRYGDIRSWDPHRDLPRDLPPNWEDVGVRYRYYKKSGYFGDRHITLEDYLKWEDWWYQYRDWLKKYGDVAADGGMVRKEMEWGDGFDRSRMGGRWPAEGGPDRKRRRF